MSSPPREDPLSYHSTPDAPSPAFRLGHLPIWLGTADLPFSLSLDYKLHEGRNLGSPR